MFCRHQWVKVAQTRVNADPVLAQKYYDPTRFKLTLGYTSILLQCQLCPKTVTKELIGELVVDNLAIGKAEDIPLKGLSEDELKKLIDRANDQLINKMDLEISSA